MEDLVLHSLCEAEGIEVIWEQMQTVAKKNDFSIF